MRKGNSRVFGLAVVRAQSCPWHSHGWGGTVAGETLQLLRWWDKLCWLLALWLLVLWLLVLWLPVLSRR